MIAGKRLPKRLSLSILLDAEEPAWEILPLNWSNWVPGRSRRIYSRPVS
jgi:hypothetical protein